MQQRLAKQSIVLAHPELYQHYADLRTYVRDSHEPQHSRSRVSDHISLPGRWIAYTASPTQTSKKEWLLVWTSTDPHHTWNQYTDAEIEAIDGQIATYVPALRLLLAQEVVERHNKSAIQEIRDQTKELGFSTTQKEQMLTASEVWDIFQKERQRFEAYTTR